jgi:hypothetical protein
MATGDNLLLHLHLQNPGLEEVVAIAKSKTQTEIHQKLKLQAPTRILMRETSLVADIGKEVAATKLFRRVPPSPPPPLSLLPPCTPTSLGKYLPAAVQNFNLMRLWTKFGAEKEE